MEFFNILNIKWKIMIILIILHKKKSTFNTLKKIQG
jgi:hypothetical protein